MIGGGAVLIAGVFSLCFIGPDTSTLNLAWRLLIVGIGLGPGQSLFSLAVLLIGFALMLMIPGVPLKDSHAPPPPKAAEAEV